MANYNEITSVKLRNTIRSMIGGSPNEHYKFYGHFCTYFNFVEMKEVPGKQSFIASVSAKNNRLTFNYNPTMIDAGTETQCIITVIHECLHVILHHHLRKLPSMNHHLANVCMDMIINSAIEKDFGIRDERLYYIPKEITKPDGTVLPAYDDVHIFEVLYYWMLNNDRVKFVPGDCLDDHSNTYVEDGVVVTQFIDDIVSKCKNRSTGLSDAISNIFGYTKKHNKVNIFKTVFGTIGNSYRRTYHKLNRRGFSELKGKSKQAKRINIILDTSGSLYNDLDEYVGHVVGEYQFRVIQCDTVVTADSICNNIADFKKLKKCGSGGTILMPAIDKLVKDKDFAPLFIITDGYTDELSFLGYKGKVTVLTTSDVPPHIGACTVIKV